MHMKLTNSQLKISCQPNAVATFEGPQISIRLIEDIPELNWQNIRISYLDQLDLPETRKAELKKNYYFDCDCPKCSDPTQTVKMNAMACPSGKDCDGFVGPEDTACPECKAEVTAEHRQTFDDVIEMTQQALIEMQNIRCKKFSFFLQKLGLIVRMFIRY